MKKKLVLFALLLTFLEIAHSSEKISLNADEFCILKPNQSLFLQSVFSLKGKESSKMLIQIKCDVIGEECKVIEVPVDSTISVLKSNIYKTKSIKISKENGNILYLDTVVSTDGNTIKIINSFQNGEKSFDEVWNASCN